MLILVLGDNLPVMFIGWEGVGLCSYLLIGFWYDERRPTPTPARRRSSSTASATSASCSGCSCCSSHTGTLDFAEHHRARRTPARPLHAARSGWGQPVGRSGSALFLFIGATRQVGADPALRLAARRDGRPDAGLGADPRRHHGDRRRLHGRAHARRSICSSPAAMAIVAVVGALTALFAAIIGFAQNDLKKVLAYSTVSQLGFMFVGVGTGNFDARRSSTSSRTRSSRPACSSAPARSCTRWAARATSRSMGGLQEATCRTRRDFLVCWLAIGGIPPFSGFFSKDAILAGAPSAPSGRIA